MSVIPRMILAPRWPDWKKRERVSSAFLLPNRRLCSGDGRFPFTTLLGLASSKSSNDNMSTKPLSCALLSSFTIDPVAGLVSARLESLGLACQWFVGQFKQYPQLILADNSELAAARPQVVILAVA